MKKIRLNFACLFVLSFLFIFSLNTNAQTNMSLKYGQGKYLVAYPNGLKYSWWSSNTSVLTVNRYGFVKPLKPGKVTVKSTRNNVKTTWVITVTNEKNHNHISIQNDPAGTIVDAKNINFSNQKAYFKSYPIQKGDAIYKRIVNKSFNPKGIVSLSSLRYIKVLHYNWNHKIQIGEMIVNKSIASNVLSIWQNLFNYEYEIGKMYLIDHKKIWKGNAKDSDDYSCSVNNTSCFCYRSIISGGKLSDHSYGKAIDINPKPNPYVYKKNGKWTCQRSDELKYINRNNNYKGMIKTSDYAYKQFIKYGFKWGGAWSSPKDYQHFYK